ncbi:hypothetical protein GCM10007385_30160 [Tateyamaria omphalii]|uniref:DUF1353 domain-containing protein n=1 Tax=Tateyamaria omphalii TaxID=299262 RepID=UPI001678B4B9|nr:DUF1353 domain-containing protein [Tateyamaria omphalii]GGX59143.1 hypothetical protein GCM10007385_30160 [Tateyamaria omphalii]
MKALLGSVATCLALTACGTVDFDAAPVGRFEGSALVVWVGPGDDSALGDGEFVYVPRPGQELTFYRGDGAEVSEGNAVIQPGAFYTDGGSVPRAVHWIQGFNAWAFGPAYIVHDWLFVVRKCINAKDPWGLESPITNMDFQESADIMAETIKTVTEQYQIDATTGDAGRVIAPTTAGPVSYGLWNDTDCANPEEDTRIQKVLADINGKEARGAALPRISDPGIEAIIERAPLPYVVVAEIGFPP